MTCLISFIYSNSMVSVICKSFKENMQGSALHGNTFLGPIVVVQDHALHYLYSSQLEANFFKCQ